MSRLGEIKSLIRGLPAAEFAELREWILEEDWGAWDAQIEGDARSGKLDKAVAEAQAHFAAGRSRKL
ncbi:MAG: hypothetical protein ACRET4_12555 [Steroidobacteraceae bacterium]